MVNDGIHTRRDKRSSECMKIDGYRHRINTNVCHLHDRLFFAQTLPKSQRKSVHLKCFVAQRAAVELGEAADACFTSLKLSKEEFLGSCFASDGLHP